MANRYWRGGSGTWNSSNTTNWSTTAGGTGGASAPTTGDSVFFTLGTTYTVTVDTNLSLSLTDFTVSAGTVTFVQNYPLTLLIKGNFSVTGSTLFPIPASGAGTIIFTNLGGAGTLKTIGTNGAALGFNVFFGYGYTYDNPGSILSSAFKTANTLTTTLFEGTLNLNGFDLSTGTFATDNNGQYNKTLIFGSGNINVTSGVSCANTNKMTMTKTTGAFTGPVNGTATYQWNSNNNGYTTLITTEAPNLTFTGAGGSTTVVQFGYTGTSSSSGMWDTINFGSTAARVYSPVGALLCKSLVLNSSVDFLTNGVGIMQHGTGTIISNGCTLYSVSMPYSICNLTLGDNLNLTNIVSHGSGTFNLNGFNVTTTSYSSNSSNARTLNFGTGNITLNSAVAGSTALSVATATGFTWTGTGGFIAAMSTTRTFTFGTTGGSTSNAPSLSLTSGASIPTLTTGSWFNILDFTGSTCTPAVTSLNLNGLVLDGGTYTSLTPTMTGTGTITSNGKTLPSLTINSSGTTTLGDALTTTGDTTITAGTLNLNGYNLATAGFSSNNGNARAINFGTGNITLNNSTAAQTVLSMANATGFTRSGTGGFVSNAVVTRTFTFGTTGGSTSNAPSLSLTSGASIPTLTTGSWFNILDFTGSTCTPAVTSLNLNGLVLDGGTYTNLTPIMRGTGTITTNGKSLPTLTIYSSGTTTLGSALTTTGATTITAGTLNLAGFTLTTPTVTSTSASTRSITGTGNINVTGNWTISNGTNFTGSGYNINMTNASAKTFTGAGGSYGALIQAGAGVLTISDSNTFADISAITRPSTITFTAGTTQTVAYFTVSGTLSNLVTINSSTLGTKFNLSKAVGAVNASYLDIQDTNVTGGATWNAYNGTNSNSGNNTGWAFVYVPPSITGQFMAFF